MNKINLSNFYIQKIAYKKYFVCLLIFIFFIIPKYNIFQVSPSLRFGIRLDDLIVFILFFALLNLIYILKRDSIVKIYITVILLLFVSSFVGFYSHGTLISFLFPLRFLEYFIFFSLGTFFFSYKINLFLFVYSIFYFQTLVSFLQFFGLVGAVYSTGEIAEGVSRVMGTFGGAWELAPSITLLSIVLVQHGLEKKRMIFSFLIYMTGFLVVLMSASRIGILAHVFMIFIFFKKYNFKTIFFITIAIPFMVITFILLSDTVVERSRGLLDLEHNVSFFHEYYEVVDPFQKDENILLGVSGGDLSWQIRAFKWTVAIKSFISSSVSILFGIGPGFMGSALDGGLLRALVENGLIFFVLYMKLFFNLSEINKTMMWIVLVLFIHMIFIDINYASKFMALLFLFAGYFNCAKKYSFEQKNLYKKIN